MNSVVFWFLFSFLVSLLAIITVYLFLNIIWDIFLRPSTVEPEPEPSPISLLRRKEYAARDVEDLTKFEKNFKYHFPGVSYSNEVQRPDLEEQLKEISKSREAINEEEQYVSTDALNGSFSSIIDDTSIEDHKCFKFNGIEEDLSDVDRKFLNELRETEKEVKKIEGEINVFTGGSNKLIFYDINEKIIKLMINLCDLYSDNEQLRKARNELMKYIEQCQNILKLKA